MSEIHIGNKIISKNPSNKLIKCCGCSNYYDFKNNIFLSYKGRILICPYCKSKHIIDFTSINNKIDGLVKINKIVLATAIDIGSPAIYGTSIKTNVTVVNKWNPANETGKITSVEIWAQTNLSNCEVATFFIVSGNILSTRDSQLIGSVTAGSKQTFPVDLEVTAGDYIGACFSGSLWQYFNGAADVLYLNGDFIPCINKSFIKQSNYVVSLYGTGSTIEPKFKDSAITGIYSFKTLK